MGSDRTRTRTRTRTSRRESEEARLEDEVVEMSFGIWIDGAAGWVMGDLSCVYSWHGEDGEAQVKTERRGDGKEWDEGEA